jgi:hypothetical protein
MSSLYEDIPAVGATESLPATTSSSDQKQKQKQTQSSLFKPRQSVVKPAAKRRSEERGRRSKTEEPREEEKEGTGPSNDDGDDEDQVVFDHALEEYDPLTPNDYIADYCHVRLSTLRQKRLEENNERIRQEREEARSAVPSHVPGIGRRVSNLPAWMTTAANSEGRQPS